MNNRVVEIDPFEDKRWDDFVREHPYGWICHLSSWKKIIERSFPHIQGHCLAIVDENNTNLIAALSLYEVNSWITGKRLVSVPFATLSDPLVHNADELTLLLDHATKILGERRPSVVEIRAFHATDILNSSKLSKGSEYVNHFLELEDGPEKLMKTVFKSSVRRGIKKASEEKIEVFEAANELDVHAFYKLYVDTRRRLGLPPQPLGFFLNLFNLLSGEGQVSFLLARLDDNIIGGIVLLKYKNRGSVDYLASDETFRGIRIDTFLWWEALKRSWQEGYGIFDFGRTSLDNEGLLAYKDRWGTIRKNITHYRTEKSQDIDKEKYFFYEPVKWICMHAPRPILQLVGKVIYRHMG